MGCIESKSTNRVIKLSSQTNQPNQPNQIHDIKTKSNNEIISKHDIKCSNDNFSSHNNLNSNLNTGGDDSKL